MGLQRRLLFRCLTICLPDLHFELLMTGMGCDDHVDDLVASRLDHGTLNPTANEASTSGAVEVP